MVFTISTYDQVRPEIRANSKLNVTFNAFDVALLQDSVKRVGKKVAVTGGEDGLGTDSTDVPLLRDVREPTPPPPELDRLFVNKCFSRNVHFLID